MALGLLYLRYILSKGMAKIIKREETLKSMFTLSDMLFVSNLERLVIELIRNINVDSTKARSTPLYTKVLSKNLTSLLNIITFSFGIFSNIVSKNAWKVRTVMMNIMPVSIRKLVVWYPMRSKN